MHKHLIFLMTACIATISFTGEEKKQQGTRTAPYTTSKALAIPRNKNNREPLQLQNSPLAQSPNLLTFCAYGMMLGSSPLKQDNSPNAWMH